jgi:hypothetical protein
MEVKYMEHVNNEEEKICKKQAKDDKNNVVSKLRFTRKNGKLYMHVWCSPDIEAIFKQAETETSSTYGKNGEKYKYYILDREIKKSLYTLENKYGVSLCNYGSILTYDGRHNFSFIRTQGISKGRGICILCDGLISLEVITTYAKAYKNFIKSFFREYIYDAVVETSIYIKEL